MRSLAVYTAEMDDLEAGIKELRAKLKLNEGAKMVHRSIQFAADSGNTLFGFRPYRPKAITNH